MSPPTPSEPVAAADARLSGNDAPATDDLQALLATEAASLRLRHTQAGNADAPQVPATRPRVGLALSGGGVRSATFALGLLRGMAQHPAPGAPGSARPATADDSNGLLERKRPAVAS